MAHVRLDIHQGDTGAGKLTAERMAKIVEPSAGNGSVPPLRALSAMTLSLAALYAFRTWLGIDLAPGLWLAPPIVAPFVAEHQVIGVSPVVAILHVLQDRHRLLCQWHAP
jgi:predicted component of type VI protein secretion system